MSKHKTITIHSRLAMDAAYHAAGLHKLCRVCGDSLARAFRVQHRCAEEKHTKNLMKVFGIDVSTDDPSIHPESFCHKCQNVIYTALKRADEGREYTPRVILFDGWVEHSANGCSICQHISKVQRGGSKKKVKAGRPARVSCQSAIRHIRSTAPPSLVTDASSHTYTAGDSPVAMSDLECPICSNILDQPVELITCRSHVCAACCCEWLKVSDTLSCPCCYIDHFHDFSSIRQGSTLILKLLGGLRTVCRECSQVVKVADYHTHSCKHSIESPSELRVQEVLQRPLNVPLTPVECKLQASLAMRSLTVSPEENILQIRTGGQVYI